MGGWGLARERRRAGGGGDASCADAPARSFRGTNGRERQPLACVRAGEPCRRRAGRTGSSTANGQPLACCSPGGDIGARPSRRCSGRRCWRWRSGRRGRSWSWLGLFLLARDIERVCPKAAPVAAQGVMLLGCRLAPPGALLLGVAAGCIPATRHVDHFLWGVEQGSREVEMGEKFALG